MSDFEEKIRLKGKAEEDRYFAQRDRELIEALHQKQSVDKFSTSADEGSMTSAEHPGSDTDQSGSAEWSIIGWFRRLISRVK